MKQYIGVLWLMLVCTVSSGQIQQHQRGLAFNDIPVRWDEALPLGNGQIGALIWKKGDQLRFSLDHAGLWDLRPMKDLHTPGFTYSWVKKQVVANQYAAVQAIGDQPYDREPAPGKIPGAALEFAMQEWGPVKDVYLDIQQAVAGITWQNGTRMQSFVHATKPVGYFRFEGMNSVTPTLVPPRYAGVVENKDGGPVAGDDLVRLGYVQGEVIRKEHTFTYRQQGWGGFYYEVAVSWKKTGTNTLEGCWAISAHYPDKPAVSAMKLLETAEPYAAALARHRQWWTAYWAKSSISLPDDVLERQYYLELYKFGSTARATTPPISLQAVWTADNGRLPPWKGDFHHDLNTQLSYWPAYSSNHLTEAMGYLNHLDNNRQQYKRYTQWYFGTDGLNVPGVTTLTGEEMGGWIQYSLSPTVAAWLAQHFYLQWRYSMDKTFLKNRAYPWFKDVARFLENITYLDPSGHRQLPLSSSPEINDNNKSAWFLENTNYDLSLMRFVFSKAAELAGALNLKTEEKHYRNVLKQFSGYHLTENQELMFAKNFPYKESHRHFSHLMAIHPLGEIRWENGAQDQAVIRNSIQLLDRIGPDYWCGYSYAWLGSLKARAKDGDGAVKALTDFATSFCSVNSFHLNGDQSKSGKSKMTYRPFTLEGNFAYAAGIQEMLLQSYAGIIEVFPAVPENWRAISFQNLRAEGAFLVSATKQNGTVNELTIMSDRGGKALIKLPFSNPVFQTKNGVTIGRQTDGVLEVLFKEGGKLTILNGKGS